MLLPVSAGRSIFSFKCRVVLNDLDWIDCVNTVLIQSLPSNEVILLQ